MTKVNTPLEHFIFFFFFWGGGGGGRWAVIRGGCWVLIRGWALNRINTVIYQVRNFSLQKLFLEFLHASLSPENTKSVPVLNSLNTPSSFHKGCFQNYCILYGANRENWGGRGVGVGGVNLAMYFQCI